MLFPFYESRDFRGKKNKNLNSCRIELDGALFALNVKMQHLEGSRFHSVSLQSIDYLLANFIPNGTVNSSHFIKPFLSVDLRPSGVFNTQLSPKMPEKLI